MALPDIVTTDGRHPFPRSYNSQIGVPLSVWLLNEQTQVGIFEAGISEPYEMASLHDIIQPTIGVLTSLGTAHQKNFRSMDEKCMEKLQLFHGAKVIAYDSDNDTISRCIRRSGYQGEKIGWSRENPSAPLYISSISSISSTPSTPSSTRYTSSTIISYCYKGAQGEYRLPFIDEASMECSFACAAIALYLGVRPEDLDARMSQLEPVAMRLEVKEGQHGCTLINDSYNSDINSLDIALDFMNRRPEYQGRRRTLILSDIQQTGMDKSELYREVSDLCQKRGVDRLIGIGTAIQSQADVITVADKAFFPGVQQFVDSPLFRSLHDEVILLKGARVFGFDHLTELTGTESS